MSLFLPNGAGETTGDQLATGKWLQLSGKVLYLDSVTGSDATSNSGTARERPLATLSRAQTLAVDGDIIVVASTHIETLTGVLAITKRIAVVGAGLTAGQPTAQFAISAAAASLFTVSANNVEFRSIKFAVPQQANTSARVVVTGTDFRFIGCRVECNGNDDNFALALNTGADRAHIRNCTFISTSTVATSRPRSALATAAISDLEVSDTTFDNGTVGFDDDQSIGGIDPYAWTIVPGGSVTRLKAQNISLLRGADVFLAATTTGWIQITLATGGARVVW